MTNKRALEILGTSVGLVLPLVVVTFTMAQEAPKDAPIALEKPVKSDDRAEWKLRDAAGAIRRARAIVGIADSAEASLKAEVVRLDEDNTPFLSEQLLHRSIWRVAIEGFKLKLPSAPKDAPDAIADSFDILIDPKSEQLLKVLSRWPKGIVRIPREASATSATEQLLASGKERYHGFPQEDPPVNLLSALDAVMKECGNPLVAKQIKAQYVIWSRLDEDPRAVLGGPRRPVWAITLRGIPPWEPKFENHGISVNARNHRRFIVDANTGKCLCGATTPQPESDEPEVEPSAP